MGLGKMGFRNGLAAAAALDRDRSRRRLRAAHARNPSPFRRPAPRAAPAPTSAAGGGEQGRTAGDFIALAAYQLGPEKPIDLPPVNLGTPPPVDPRNVYAGAAAGMFSPAVAGQPTRVYSPNLVTGRVDVIDPETFTVIDSLDAMPSPEHIVPSWDLQTLWVSATSA